MIVDTKEIAVLAVQTVVILTGASGLVGFIWYRVRPAIELLSSIGIRQSKMETVVNETVLPTLAKLEKEIATNGGSVSVKDKVAINEILINTVADGMTTAMYRCDGNGRCVWANHSLCRLFGLSAQDMMHFGWSSVVDPSERDEVIKKWRYSIDSGSPYDDEYTIINALTGSKIKCRTYATPMRHGQDGKIIFWSGSVIVIDRQNNKD